MGWQIKRLERSDLEQVFALQVRCDIAEYGEADSELSDLEHDWERLVHGRDGWVVRGEGGALVGYAAVVPSFGERRVDIYLDPTLAGSGLDRHLLARCEGRLKDLAREHGLRSHTYCAQVNEAAREPFLAAGFAYSKSFYQMRIELDGPLQPPRWPAGVSVRRAIAEVDDRAIYTAVQDAFERKGEARPNFEDWRFHTIRPETYDPALWFLAVAGEEIVGTCIGIRYEKEGWIRQFGVLPAWRRRGIATALLRHAFLAFRERGYPAAGLGMEAENARALRLYERVGMHIHRQYDEYCKTYPPADDSP